MFLFKKLYISLKFETFGPCKILQPYLTASKGFCPPCIIIDPPKKPVLHKLKKDFDFVTVIHLLDLENIPEQARRYITIRASRIFHDRTLGANAIHKFSQQDELSSLALLKQTEADTADHNIFDSLDQYQTVNRNSRIKFSS